MKAVNYIKRQPKPVLVALTVVLVVIVGAADWLSGPEVAFSIFYLIPICFIVWFAGKPAGIVIALLSAVAWLVVDLFWRQWPTHPFIPYWNVAVRLGFFVAITFLLAELKAMKETLEKKVEERTAALTAENTERNRAEEQVRASEQRFRQLAEAINEVFWLTNLEKTEMIYISPGYEKIWGRSRDSLRAAARSWLDAIHPEDRERVQQAAMIKQASGGYNEEYRIVRPDASVRWIRDRAFPVRDAAGNIYRIAGIAEDITEGKEAEARLATLAHGLESTTELICITDLQDRFIFANRAFQKAHGYTEAEILGKTPEILHSSRNPPSLITEVLEQTRLGGWQGEVLDRRKDGTEFPVHLSTSLVKDRTGEVIGLMGVARDITERKLAEEALQRQQAELRVLFDLIPALIWFKDTENGILRVNKRAAETAGKSVAEIEGKSTHEIYPQEAAKFYADDLEVIRSGVPKLGIIETLRDREGKELWIQTDKVPYCDKDGKVIGIVVLAQDITERRRAEESLRLLGSAVEQSKESIVITDAKLDLPGPRILFVNPAFTKMTGYTANEVLGKTPRVLQGPLTDRTVLRRLRHTLARGESFHGEAVNYRKDGTEFHLEWQIAPIRDANGVITHFVAIQRDITERKLAELQLATLAHGIESTAELICITDLHDRFIFANRAFQEAYGYTEAEILGKTPEILYSSHNPPSLVTEVLEQTPLRGWQGEVLNRRKDGTEFPIFLSTSQIRDQSGNIIGLMGVARDITERKRLEKEILEISEREQSRIGQDLHDSLCQDLVGIAYAAGILEEKLREKSVAEVAEANEIARLISVAVIQARELARVLYPVKLEAEGLASALLELATNVARRTAIVCTMDCPQPVVVSDRSAAIHMFRIAQEAVSNAVKHAKARHIWIQLDAQADTITLTVRDDGGGIVHPPASATGMGLNIMNYRARMIGATLEVLCDPRGGTIIKCSLQQEADRHIRL